MRKGLKTWKSLRRARRLKRGRHSKKGTYKPKSTPVKKEEAYSLPDITFEEYFKRLDNKSGDRKKSK